MKSTHLDSTSPWLNNVRAGLLLVAATLVAYVGVLNNDFVNWDDYEVVVDNPHYRGFDAASLRWMFTASHAGHYQPLTWLSYAVDAGVWGGVSATGVHLTNLVLHVVTAVLFFLVSRALIAAALEGRGGGSSGTTLPGGAGSGRDVAARSGVVTAGALTAALLFAVHPLRVESVAWATERRDVLSGAWLMAALWLYLKQANAARGPRRIMLLAASLSCYVLSLLSKAAGVPLPAVLIAIDLYPLRRISIGDRRELLRALAEKALFAVPAGVFALTAIWAQSDAGAMRSMAEHGLGDRVAQGFFGLAFYLGKTVWPSGLLPLYEWPDDASPMDARVLISVAVILVLAGAAWVWRRRRPAVATALFCYVALVSPVLGVAQSGPQVAADRYTYLPMMPWAVAAGGGMAWFLATASAAGRRRAGLGVVAVTVVFVVLTRAQVSVWATPESLWTHMVEHNPQHPKGWSGLAGALRRRAAVSGDAALIRQAAEYYDRAMALRPDMLSPHVGAGHCAADLGDFDAAVRHYHDALALKPTDEDALRGLAHVLGVAGRFNEADEAYARVFEVLPDAIDAHYAYANLLNRQQRYAEAATQFEIVISRGGPDARAMAADACYGLSLALEQSGDEAAAIAALRRGLALDERHVLLTARLAWMLAAPTDPQWLDPAEALRLAQRAVALCEGTSVVADEALAAAQAAGGDFDAAVATLDARLQTAGQEEPGWVARLRAQRDAYRNGRTGPP